MAVIGISGSIILLAINYHFLWVADTTTGTLVSEPQSHKVGTRHRHTEYYITYTFEVDGQHYQGKDSVTEYPNGSIITVYYNRNNPNDNKAERPTIMGWWFVLGISCLLWVITWSSKKKETLAFYLQRKT